MTDYTTVQWVDTNQAIYSLLTGDSALMNLINAVGHYQVADGTSFPYLVYYNLNKQPGGYFQDVAGDFLLQFDIIDAYTDRLSFETIMDADAELERVLSHQTITVGNDKGRFTLKGGEAQDDTENGRIKVWSRWDLTFWAT